MYYITNPPINLNKNKKSGLLCPHCPPRKKITSKPTHLPRSTYSLNKYNKAALKWARTNDMYWSGKEWFPNRKSQKNEDSELTEEEIHRNNRIVAQKLSAIQHWATTSVATLKTSLQNQNGEMYKNSIEH